MSVRASIITFVAVAVLGLAAVLLAGSADERSTAFSLGVPPASPVATLQPGQPVCQGPIDPTAAFGSVSAWTAAIGGSEPPLRMDVRSPGGQTLATGTVAGGYGAQSSPTFRLSPPLPAGRPIDVCLTDTGSGPVSVLGEAPGDSISESHAGTVLPATGPVHLAMALLFERPHPRPLLSMLPTVFSRAALFKPGWVGAWTFWVLGAALLGAFGLGAVAVTHAVRADG